MSDEYLDYAASLGFSVSRAQRKDLDPAALRVMPQTDWALPVKVSADAVEVMVDHVPTPAEFEALERACGLAVSVTVTTPLLLAAAREYLDTRFSDESLMPLRAVLAAATSASALSVVLAPSAPPVARSPIGDFPLQDFPMVSPVVFAQWQREFFQDEQLVLLPSGADSWRLRLSGGAITASRLPSRPMRADELRLPALASSFSGFPSGLVVISGPPASGRSSVALALAERSLSAHPRPSALVSPLAERMLSDLAAPTSYYSSASSPSAVQSALAAGAKVIVVDDPASPGIYKEAMLAASAGALVFLTVMASTSIGAAALLRESISGDMLSANVVGLLSCRALPSVSGELTPCFEVILTSPSLELALRSDPYSIPNAVEVAGSRFGVLLESSLASAVAAGLLPFEYARSHSPNPQFFDAATGRLDALLPSSSKLEDFSVLTQDMVSDDPAPPQSEGKKKKYASKKR